MGLSHPETFFKGRLGITERCLGRLTWEVGWLLGTSQNPSLLVSRTTASTKKPPSRLPWLCPSLRTEAQPGHPPQVWGRRHSPASRDGAMALLPWHLRGNAPYRAKWNFTQGELVSEPQGWDAG